MRLENVNINTLFEVIAFLFAISAHESAHAWMANLRGDPTARMLGRVTLNPIKHIDLVGTILLPVIAVFANLPPFGWAKPTPVNPKNFRNPVLDDILTSVVGPVSNFVVAMGATIVLLGIKMTSAYGRQVIEGVTLGTPVPSDSLMVPLCMLLHALVGINVLLAVFNLIPVPPLDGSHVVRHLMSDSVRRVYDMMGFAGLMLLVYFGSRLLTTILSPFLYAFDWILLNA